jgi:hypothetical protein
MMGAVVRLRGKCFLPWYGRGIGTRTGYITNMIERKKMSKVAME